MGKLAPISPAVHTYAFQIKSDSDMRIIGDLLKLVDLRYFYKAPSDKIFMGRMVMEP